VLTALEIRTDLHLIGGLSLTIEGVGILEAVNRATGLEHHLAYAASDLAQVRASRLVSRRTRRRSILMFFDELRLVTLFRPPLPYRITIPAIEAYAIDREPEVITVDHAFEDDPTILDFSN
jgi:hypothetical protein